jgi:hypothetical protein
VAGLLLASCPHCEAEFGPYDATKEEDVDALRTEVALHAEEHGKSVVINTDGTLSEAPAPAVEEAVPASKVKPCICGFVGKDGKEAGTHKRSCKVWKANKAPMPVEVAPVAPAPVAPVVPAPAPAPVVVVEPALATVISQKSWEERIDAALNAVLAKIGNSVDQAAKITNDAASLYNKVEYATLKLQKIDEALASLKEYAALDIMVEEYKDTLRSKMELEALLKYAKLDDQYDLGARAVNLVITKTKKKHDQGVKDASDHNSTYQNKVDAQALVWEREQSERYEKVLKGSLRILNSKKEAVTLVSDVNRTVSSRVSELSKAKAYNMSLEYGLCYDEAEEALKGLGFKAEKVFPLVATRKDVDEEGNLVESKYTFKGIGRLPVTQWATEMAKAIQYCRRRFRDTGKKMSPDEAMAEQDFAKLFGWNIQPDSNAEPLKVKWVNPNNLNEDGSDPTETTMQRAYRLAEEKRAQELEQAARTDPDGDHLQEEKGR